MSWFPVVVVAIVFGSIVAVVAIIAGLIGVAIRATRGPATQRGVDDTKIIQEIYRGLQRMEERVESLETLLLEKEKKQI